MTFTQVHTSPRAGSWLLQAYRPKSVAGNDRDRKLKTESRFKSELGVQRSVSRLKQEKEQEKWWVEERTKLVHGEMATVGREAQREGNDVTHTLLDP